MRRKKKEQREIAPDPRYGNAMVAKFINYAMRRGKKSLAERIVYQMFDVLEKKYREDPLTVFDRALRNAGPTLEVKSRRIGGATYQVPREVRGDRRLFLAAKWILDAARARNGTSMHEKLAGEILAASKNEGAAVKKKLDMHRMAEANRAFAHFSW